MTVPVLNAHFIPFHVPCIGEEEIAEVCDTLRSGWLTTGPKAKQFEEEFAAYIGAGLTAIAVNSATSGLHLALEAVGIGPGDEVITTPYTFTATAEVIRYLGAHPVFVDVKQDTLNIDPTLLEDAVTPRTKAIIPVHFAGLACDMNAIISIARRYGLKIVEDAAHALPATSGGIRIGNLDSDATVFSFYATKTLATGEGGMVITRSSEIAKRCSIMRLHGIDRDAFDRYTSETPAWFYQVVAAGYKYNMTDVAAAIGLQQLRKVEGFQQTRERLVLRYDAAFEGLPVRRPVHAPPGNQHAWHLYVLRLDGDAAITRNEFIEEMARAGIGTSVHFIPLYLHPYWRDTYRIRPEQFPRSTQAFQQAVSLPLYPGMTDSDQDRVIIATRSILSRARKTTVTCSAVNGGPKSEAGLSTV